MSEVESILGRSRDYQRDRRAKRLKDLEDAEKNAPAGKEPFDLPMLQKYFVPGPGLPLEDDESVLRAREIYYLEAPELRTMEALGRFLSDREAHQGN